MIQENLATCKEKAGTDVCGWGADGDIYLDAQEIDPQLTFKNSQFVITAVDPETVKVSFNVYPSLKESKDFYNRTIVYHMLLEKGKWVVNDLISNDSSARKIIQEEINSFKSK
ncbi:MAG: hypothetical protein WA160_15955 [Pseudobdellovibrio sp.]